jgi:membrane protein YqaA with SNARE-associated domain
LLSWLPVIGDPLCVAAGWLRLHWFLSLVFIGIGKTARYAVLLYLLV